MSPLSPLSQQPIIKIRENDYTSLENADPEILSSLAEKSLKELVDQEKLDLDLDKFPRIRNHIISINSAKGILISLQRLLDANNISGKLSPYYRIFFLMGYKEGEKVNVNFFVTMARKSQQFNLHMIVSLMRLISSQVENSEISRTFAKLKDSSQKNPEQLEIIKTASELLELKSLLLDEGSKDKVLPMIQNLLSRNADYGFLLYLTLPIEEEDDPILFIKTFLTLIQDNLGVNDNLLTRGKIVFAALLGLIDSLSKEAIDMIFEFRRASPFSLSAANISYNLFFGFEFINQPISLGEALVSLVLKRSFNEKQSVEKLCFLKDEGVDFNNTLKKLEIDLERLCKDLEHQSVSFLNTIRRLRLAGIKFNSDFEKKVKELQLREQKELANIIEKEDYESLSPLPYEAIFNVEQPEQRDVDLVKSLLDKLDRKNKVFFTEEDEKKEIEEDEENESIAQSIERQKLAQTIKRQKLDQTIGSLKTALEEMTKNLKK
jgi:hypothetical protein